MASYRENELKQVRRSVWTATRPAGLVPLLTFSMAPLLLLVVAACSNESAAGPEATPGTSSSGDQAGTAMPATTPLQTEDEATLLNTLAPAPRAMLYAMRGWELGLSFEEMAVTVDIHNDIEYRGDNGLYLIACTPFLIGENGAYFGLQTDVNTGPKGGWQSIGKGAIFSVWDAPDETWARGPEGSWIESGDYEGSFLSVRSPYEWTEGQYTLRVSAEETDEHGSWFGLYLNDAWMGSLRFAANARIKPMCDTTIEVYGQPVKPADIPYWRVSVRTPVADGVPAALLHTFYPRNVENLRNTLITVKGDAVTFEVGLDHIAH